MTFKKGQRVYVYPMGKGTVVDQPNNSGAEIAFDTWHNGWGEGNRHYFIGASQIKKISRIQEYEED